MLGLERAPLVELKQRLGKSACVCVSERYSGSSLRQRTHAEVSTRLSKYMAK